MQVESGRKLLREIEWECPGGRGGDDGLWLARPWENLK